MEECLITTRKQISLDTKRIYCDLYEFQQMQNMAWKTEKEMERLKELYRGGLFQGKTYEWSFAKAHTLEKNMISNLLKAGELREDQNRTEEAERLYLHALNWIHITKVLLTDFWIFITGPGGRKKKNSCAKRSVCCSPTKCLTPYYF